MQTQPQRSHIANPNIHRPTMTLFRTPSSSRVLLLSALFVWTALPAWAEKPDWAPGGQQEKHQKQGDKHNGKHGHKEQREDRRDDQHKDRHNQPAPVVRSPSSGALVNIQIGSYFADPQRVLVRDHYEPRMKAGKCPRGLKKKDNGCLPPGLAKDWRRGQPLPSTVVYYPTPQVVQARLGIPPAGHRFVRVASDILLIAVGTSMVIDAIEDLGRR
jgi:Ni/Co efflux regulator RcnB